jgi:N-acylneuraminate cytidylyltransferase
MKNICIIPARGGSKRVPDKNVMEFGGKPMIAHTIEAAIDSGLFGEHIYISSDSEKILNVADKYPGVKKIVRPDELATDTASHIDAILHALKYIEEKNPKEKFDTFCMLGANCPLRNSADIKQGYETYNKSGAKNLMSVVAYHWLYPFWALEEKNERLDFYFGKEYLKDSKLLPKDIYCPIGALYFLNIENFKTEKKFYSDDLAKYEIPFERSVDIDTPEDLELARKFYEWQKK